MYFEGQNTVFNAVIVKLFILLAGMDFWERNLKIYSETFSDLNLVD
jgi:hypothetical protein